jgi:hypothetical protein
VKKNNRVQEKGYGNSFGHKNKKNKIGHWEENKGILTLAHNNYKRKLGSIFFKSLKNRV